MNALRAIALLTGMITMVAFVATPGPFPVATWQLDPRYPVTTDATEVHLLVRQYAGAAVSEPQAPIAPRVAYAANSIAISVPIRVVSACLAQAEPSYQLAVHLDQPLGNRSVLPGPGLVVLDNLVGYFCGTTN